MANKPLDPHTATRRQFTSNLVDQKIPPNPNSKYSNLAATLKDLLKALAYHPAMEDNIDQTYMTPANWKNKVYFMWDFVGRTLATLEALDPTLPASQAEMWEEVEGRSAYCSLLIKDTTGKLDIMCPDERKSNVQFSPEIIELADKIATE